MTEQSTEITIRYAVSTRDGRTAVQEKTFPSEAAMLKWVRKAELRDNWCGIVSYSR